MPEFAYKEWKSKSQKFKLRNDPFIDGKFINAHSQQTYKIYDPISEHLLASVASCDNYDVDQGIQSARRLYASGQWTQTPINERKEILNSFIRLIVDNKEELALLETLNMGKQAVDLLHLDTMGASAILRWYAKREQENYTEVAFSKNMHIAHRKRSSPDIIGIVGVVIPCNFPLYQILFKILPLLLAGNSVVINPPIQSPHGILRVAEISVLAGLPKGLFNVLPGSTHRAGRALALHGDIDRLFVYMPWGSKTYSLNFANPIKPLKQILLNVFRKTV